MRITQKGQVTIPKKFRDRFGLTPNTEVRFEEVDGEVRIVAEKSRSEKMKEWIEQVKGSADSGMTTDEIMQLTRGE
ncbi:MAG: AbrB/MazE/SpoVT family DNA-binding domain-containing protein [Verrucomicrobiota bacterium]